MTAPRWDDPGPTPTRSEFTLGGVGVLRVDPERIEPMIVELRAAADQLIDIELSLEPLAILSPGHDPVSMNAATQAATMLENSRAYLAGWREQLQRAAEALEQQLAGYLAADRTSDVRA